jgi:fructose-1,6-bisphosphatase/inositol monophosphatase family enzyme
MRSVAEAVIRPRFRSLANSQIAEKTPGDYVTVADREAEERLTEALSAAYPEAAVIGEEAVFADPSLLDGLAEREHAFVVDPVDGTRNFVQGNPDYAVMIGELRLGVTVRAWIWQPEHDVALVGRRGGGVERNGVPLRPLERPARPRGVSAPRKFRGLSDPLLAAPIARSWSSCGIDYPNLLAGAADFICFNPPKPWDHVPGVLFLRELGGVARTVAGIDYGPAVRDGYLIAAATPAAWQAAEAVVTAKLADA